VRAIGKATAVAPHKNQFREMHWAHGGFCAMFHKGLRVRNIILALPSSVNRRAMALPLLNSNYGGAKNERRPSLLASFV
jgi:hypothetical protein